MSRTSLLMICALLLTGCAASFFNAQGRQALGLGQYPAAIQAFTAALVEQPQNPEALTGLGIAYYKMEAYSAAVETLEEAKKLAPHNPETRLYLGLAYLKQGQEAQAASELHAYAKTAGSRMAAQIDEALALVRKEGKDTEALRTLVAMNIEEWARREQEMRELERRLLEATSFGHHHSGVGFVIRLR